MSESSQKPELSAIGKSAVLSASHAASVATLDIIDVVKRQFPLICCAASVGILLGVIYWANAQVWYESQAKMLVTLKDMRAKDTSGDSGWGQDRVQESTLANHMEIVRSRNIITKALARANWDKMPFFQDLIEQDPDFDPVVYVSEHLTLTKGGTGTARDARSLNIKFRHTDPHEALVILQAIVIEYETFLDDQVNRMMSSAIGLIKEAQSKVEQELKAAEEKYISARRSAPILYSGEGSSNVYLDRFRRIQDELSTVDIERSSVTTRLRKVEDSLKEIREKGGDPLDMVALVDSASLERLSAFLTLQSGHSAEFMKDMPERTATTNAKYQLLTSLKSQLNELVANFGPGHPRVEILKKEIQQVEELVNQGTQQTKYQGMFDQITPERLMQAYTGFLRQDLAASNDRRAELMLMGKAAEDQSKQLIEFELRDKLLATEITRKQSLYDGIVDQVRNMDTATGLSGYTHEVLDPPLEGEAVWPQLPLCGAGGLLAGIMVGFCLAIMLDQLDNRFRVPSEIDSLLSLPVIGQVGRIHLSRDQRRSGRLICNAQAPEAEAFRLFRTYLLREVKSGNLRTAMVTSCQAKDGKSTVLANLGASFSELGIRTLIIDGDMRAPTQNRFFQLEIEKGLSEVLRGEATIDEVIQYTGLDGLSLISAGGPVRNPAELLQSESFDQLLSSVKSQYNLVLVDTGPALLVSDPAIVLQKCDIGLLVVRAATDTKRKVQEAVRRLRAASPNLRGCIVNTFGSSKGFTRESGDAAGSYYYGYGYGNRTYGNRPMESSGTPPSSSQLVDKEVDG